MRRRERARLFTASLPTRRSICFTHGERREKPALGRTRDTALDLGRAFSNTADLRLN